MQTVIDAPTKNIRTTALHKPRARRVPAKARLTTADDLLRISVDSSHRYELIQGALITMSPAGYKHGDYAMGLGARLRVHAEDYDLGTVFAAETGFQLTTNPDTVRAPDASFVRKERIPRTSKFAYFPGAPDLAVEVVSPNDRAEEVQEKVQMWFHHGTKLVWVVEPRTQTVTVFRIDGSATVLKANDTLNGEDLIPGFSYPITKLFSG